MSKRPMITIYTDGGCRNNQSQQATPSAYAFRISGLHDHQTGRSEYIVGSEAFVGRTNNQMELMAVINGLATAKTEAGNRSKQIGVTIISDSRYVDDAFNQGWITGWMRRNFRRVKNAGYWELLVEFIKQFASVDFIWVKGHADNAGNNYVDHTLNRAMDLLQNEHAQHVVYA